MTYYDIIQRFFDAAERNFMIADVGYGPVSDIKTRSQNAQSDTTAAGEIEGVDYPYMFLNPTQHSRTNASITYSFNLIMMDMAWQEVPTDPNEGVGSANVTKYTNEAQVQSNCQRLIDDIIADLYFDTDFKAEISMDLIYTPFVERFQDSVAGMTAQIKIEVPQPINDCFTPST